MCDASIPSMPCGAECDTLMGSYERSRGYTRAETQSNMTHSSFMPGFIQPQVRPDLMASGYGARRISESRDHQPYVYQASRNQTQLPEPYYFSQHAPSPPSARDPANLLMQSMPSQSVPMYRAFNIPSHGGFGSSFPPSHACMAKYSMGGMPFTSQKSAGFGQNAYSGGNMPYGSCYPSGNISPQQQHILF